MGRLRNLRSRVVQLGPRIPILELPEIETMSPDARERAGYYHSARWRDLRKEMLKTRECRRCMFCGNWANVLEHVVGHGEDAIAVAEVLGLPRVDPDWRARFWVGPFAGSCDLCARSRSGAETSGRLLRWTEKWLAKKRDQADAAGRHQEHW